MPNALTGHLRVEANRDRCDGHGQCLLAAPTVFDVDEKANKVILLDPEPVEGLRAAVQRAVSMCPMGALEIVG
ncbi:ferredoxin [Sporichthya sp.]|uniref:ferredoxin n=1 Tax=Sporichthya sp. TaxID=65475 RepID=UPI00182EE379|nr:ferredoxin [Sporichthya sp.]MBA3745090.1 ferredoxin [Sporichthya sp.]